MSAASADRDYRIKDGPWAGAWKIALGVGVVGLGASLAGGGGDPTHRFAFSYLFAFAFFLTLALGSTFFVLLQHVTSAGWSVVVRRVAEFFMSALPVMALLFIPVAMNVDSLYAAWVNAGHGQHGVVHEGGHTAGGEHGAPSGEHGTPAGEHAAPSHGEHGAPTGHVEHGGPAHGVMSQEHIEHEAHSRVIASKTTWYLYKEFFFARAIFYFLAWAFISWRLFKNSTEQDRTRDPKWTSRSQAMAPPSLFVMGLTLTFAAFDWYMSLEPSWYSTIFGVWHFAGSMVVTFATITLVTLSLRARGHMGDAVSVEHFHDLGKLLFGFNCFWAYIAFSQFFLIWYAGIPEEVTFYHNRWSEGPWKNVSLLLPWLHFALPFWFLMSRNVKRNLSGLAAGAVLLWVMHLVEIYWLVMPNYALSQGISPTKADSLSFHWLDVTCLLGVGGVYLAAVFYRMATHPVLPVGDPRLDRSRHFEQA